LKVVPFNPAPTTSYYVP